MQLLRRVHSELMSELSPPESVDPLTVLPRELAEFVLEYLTFQQRINACLVSKQWAQFIRSTPNLWQHLDLSGARRKVRSAFVSRAINTARQKLTAATLSMLHDFDKSLVALIRHCPLDELVLLETGLQSQNLVEALGRAKHLRTLHLAHGTEIGSTALAQLVQTCAGTLQDLRCSLARGQAFTGLRTLCPHLETLSITFGPSLHGRALFPTLPEFAPNLRSLTIHAPNVTGNIGGAVDLSKLQNLQSLNLKMQVSSAHLLSLPSSLTSLSLAITTPLQAFFANHGVSSDITTFDLPLLQELSTDIRATSVNGIVNVLATRGAVEAQGALDNRMVTPSKLQKLSIRSATMATAALSTLLSDPRLDHLLHFTLQPTGPFTDEDVHVIAERLPKLQTLDVSGTDITGVGVKDLVQRGHVKYLVLHNCRMLGTDAVEWARSRGVRVDYCMTNGESGGKKLRY